MEPSPRRPVGEAFLIRRELEGVDVGGVVAGIDAAQPLEALHQQRRADEQHECERRLPDDEHVAPQWRRPVLPRPPSRSRPRSGDEACSAGIAPQASAATSTSPNAAASGGQVQA